MSSIKDDSLHPTVALAPKVYGTNAEAVIAAIRDRAQKLRAQISSDDPRKIALVIEGGSMRGICSAGGAAALSHLGFESVFDEVYATSAGAMNASYFLSGQPKLGISIYLEDMVSKRIVNPFRFWKIMNLDYLFDRVVGDGKRLDVKKILANRTKFLVAMMDRVTGEGVLIDTKRLGDDLVRALRGATAIPVLYNRSVVVQGRPRVDGGLLSPFPLEHAIANGATDILILLSYSADFERLPPGWFSRLMYRLLFARTSSHLNRIFALSYQRDRIVRDLAMGRTKPPSGVNIATLCAQTDNRLSRITSDSRVLTDCAVSYARQTLRVFGASDDAWTLSDLPK